MAASTTHNLHQLSQPGRALCHTEAQKEMGSRLAQTYIHLEEIKLKACILQRGPVQQSDEEQYVLPTGRSAVTTCGVCVYGALAWLAMDNLATFAECSLVPKL